MFVRLATFCYRHRFLVMLAWLVIFAGGIAASGPVFNKLNADSDVHFESTDGYDALNAAATDGGTVIAVVDRVDPKAASTRAAVTSAATAIKGIDGVVEVEDPYSAGPAGPALVAKDGEGVLVIAHLAKDLGDQEDAVVDDAAARMRDIPDGVPGATVKVGGDSLLDREINDQVGKDLSTAELVSLPLTLLFMVVVFAGFVAAGLPVLGALVSIGAAMLGLWGFSTFAAVDTNTLTVCTLLGLGLSIDYGLLMVSRYREELAAGNSREAAIGRTGATAGRTIAFSALTAAAALGGLLLVQVPFLQAIGVAGVSIAIVTMLVAQTLIPALIRVSGRWIKPRRGRRAAVKQLNRIGTADGGVFGRLARRVQRRPVLVLVLTLAALLVAAAPVLGVKLTDPQLDGIPNSLESKQVVNTLDDRFGRQESPAITVVARTDAVTLDQWAAGHASDAGVVRVYRAEQVAPNLARVDIGVPGDPRGGPARDLVDRLRADRPGGAQSWVTGSAAFFDDALNLLKRDLPRAMAVMVVAMMVLLFLLTGSVVMPVKALLMNLVSMGATFGVLIAVFQWGWGADLGNLIVLPGMDPFLLVILFAFAFGLSMDYEVFLLSRIKEAYDAGLPNDEAVRAGLQKSGRIITSAAACMVIVFSCFVIGKISTIQQIGLGLVVAVIVDATIVRCLLVPATMTLLGRANWWAPGPLRRFHARFGLHDAPVATPEPEPELARIG